MHYIRISEMSGRIVTCCLQIFFLAIIVFGCTPVSLNTGATDYARADSSQEPIYGDGRFESLKQKYDVTPEVDKLIIKKGESISVTLQHVFIKDFSERLERLTSKIIADSVRGEIAILAKVYEQTDGTHIDHTMAGIKKSGRLIYYSEDVRSGGHPLNFSQLPVYGPIEYKGNSLVVQFTVLELDVAESNQLKGILSTLAEMGKKSYAPASPVLEVLDSISNNLLSGDQDDQELTYAFTLHPNTGHASVKDAKLMVGNYVLIKEDPIKRPVGGPFNVTDWSEFRFDTNRGRLEYLVEGEGNANVWTDFLDKSYVVLQIDTGLPSVGLDVAQAFSELGAELAGESDNSDFVNKMVQSVDKFKNYSIEKKQKDEIKRMFSNAMTHLKEYDSLEDSLSKKVALASFFDIVVSKRGFPAASAVGNTQLDFEGYQWDQLVRSMRSFAVDPYKISKSSIVISSDYSELELLLK